MDPLFCLRVYQFSTVFVRRNKSARFGTTTSDDLLFLHAIRHVATAPGECLIVGDFNTSAVDWPYRTCPKSDGFDKNFRTTAEEKIIYQSITQPTRFRMGNRPSVLDLVFTKFSDTVPAIKLLAPLGSSDHAKQSFTCGLHDSHEPTRPRVKWCYNERMKDAVEDAAALLDWNDVSFARNVVDQWNLIKKRILCLRDRFATIICSRKGANRTP